VVYIAAKDIERNEIERKSATTSLSTKKGFSISDTLHRLYLALRNTMSDHDSISGFDDGHHGGCTQADSPSVGNIFMTQVDAEIDVQDLLREEYKKNPANVTHIGILIETDGSKVPEFFFTDMGVSSVTIGSGYIPNTCCEIRLLGKESAGISNHALKITCDNESPRHLSFLSINRNPIVLHHDNANIGGVRVVFKNDQGALHEGDSLEFKSAKVIISFHGAPLYQDERSDSSNEQDSSPHRTIQQSCARRFQEPAYRRKRLSAIEKKAYKASSKLHAGKYKDKKDKNQLQKILRKATQHICPHAGAAGRSCERPSCLFKHGSENSTEENVHDIQGTIRLWQQDSPRGAFGFIDANNQSFYFQRSSLSRGSSIPRGTKVIFDSSPAPFEGGSCVAHNIREI
jgi:hypothetical protein